jgi:hypothetical protein
MDYFIVAKRDGVPAVPVPDMTGISGKRDEGVAVGAILGGAGDTARTAGHAESGPGTGQYPQIYQNL